MLARDTKPRTNPRPARLQPFRIVRSGAPARRGDPLDRMLPGDHAELGLLGEAAAAARPQAVVANEELLLGLERLREQTGVPHDRQRPSPRPSAERPVSEPQAGHAGSGRHQCPAQSNVVIHTRKVGGWRSPYRSPRPSGPRRAGTGCQGRRRSAWVHSGADFEEDRRGSVFQSTGFYSEVAYITSKRSLAGELRGFPL